jgi:hypothetical protein
MMYGRDYWRATLGIWVTLGRTVAIDLQKTQKRHGLTW